MVENETETNRAQGIFTAEGKDYRAKETARIKARLVSTGIYENMAVDLDIFGANSVEIRTGENWIGAHLIEIMQELGYEFNDAKAQRGRYQELKSAGICAKFVKPKEAQAPAQKAPASFPVSFTKEELNALQFVLDDCLMQYSTILEKQANSLNGSDALRNARKKLNRAQEEANEVA